MNNIEIEISGISNISSELQIQFFDEFSRRLNELQFDSNINDTISKSLISTLYTKPTDTLEKCKRIRKDEENIQCNICFEQFKENEYKIEKEIEEIEEG